MPGGFQSEVGNALKYLAKVHYNVILQWFHKPVLSVNKHLESRVFKCCQNSDESAILVRGSCKLQLLGTEAIVTDR